MNDVVAIREGVVVDSISKFEGEREEGCHGSEDDRMDIRTTEGRIYWDRVRCRSLSCKVVRDVCVRSDRRCEKERLGFVISPRVFTLLAHS